MGFLGMESFSQVRARVGAARVLLEQAAQGPSRISISTLQTMALVDLLQTTSAHLSSEQKAVIGEQVVGAGFEEPDQAIILEALTHGCLSKGRRKQQDGMAFLQYLSADEWKQMGQLKVMEVANLLINVAMCRLCIVNPSEPTKKLIASAALVLTTDNEKIDCITLEAKDAMKKWVGKRCKALADKLTSQPVEYCLVLPFSPADLQLSHPKLYRRAAINGCFVPSQIDEQVLAQVDNTYQCRNTLTAGRPTALVPSTMGMTPTDMMMMMMTHMSNMNRPRGDQELELQMNPGGPRKRAPAMLGNVLTAAGDSSNRTLGVAGCEPRADQLRRCFTVHDDHAPLMGTPKKHEESPVAAAAVEVQDAEAPVELRVQEVANNNTLLEGMVARDAEKAACKKAAAAEIASAKKVEKELAKAVKVVEKADAHAKKPAVVKPDAKKVEAEVARMRAVANATTVHEKKITKQDAPPGRILQPGNAVRRERLRLKAAEAQAAVKSFLSAAVTTAAVAETPPAKKYKRAESSSKLTPHTSDAKPKPKKNQNPCVSHELSRQQFLARSANDGSKTFRYGKGYAYLQQAAAQKAATLWLEAH